MLRCSAPEKSTTMLFRVSRLVQEFLSFASARKLNWEFLNLQVDIPEPFMGFLHAN